MFALTCTALYVDLNLPSPVSIKHVIHLSSMFRLQTELSLHAIQIQGGNFGAVVRTQSSAMIRRT